MHTRFPDRLLLPLAFEPARLAADLKAIEAAGWTGHFVKQNYDGDWSAIALRAPKGETHPLRMIYSDPACSDFVDTPLLAAAPYFREVLAAFACPLMSARLMRLAAGSRIKEHTDHDLAFEEGKVRIHIPVVTNAQVSTSASTARLASCRPAPPGTCASPTRTAWPTGVRPPASIW